MVCELRLQNTWNWQRWETLLFQNSSSLRAAWSKPTRLFHPSLRSRALWRLLVISLHTLWKTSIFVDYSEKVRYRYSRATCQFCPQAQSANCLLNPSDSPTHEEPRCFSGCSPQNKHGTNPILLLRTGRNSRRKKGTHFSKPSSKYTAVLKAWLTM